MKVIGSLLGTLLVILLLLAIGGALVFLIAYGLGWAVNLIADFEPFQATVLGILSIVAAGILADRIWNMVKPVSTRVSEDELDDEFDYDDFEDFEDEEEEDEEENKDKLYPGIPRWRQPLKTVDFSKAQPNDRCPCGSGRKFKNCHGRKAASS